jgi:hypothetical protein
VLFGSHRMGLKVTSGLGVGYNKRVGQMRKHLPDADQFKPKWEARNG